jgi:uncharacterized metal-binding protein
MSLAMARQNPEAHFPAIPVFACFSGASNTGTLTRLAALEAVKRLGEDLNKKGSFSSLVFSGTEVALATEAIVAAIQTTMLPQRENDHV